MHDDEIERLAAATRLAPPKLPEPTVVEAYRGMIRQRREVFGVSLSEPTIDKWQADAQARRR